MIMTDDEKVKISMTQGKEVAPREFIIINQITSQSAIATFQRQLTQF